MGSHLNFNLNSQSHLKLDEVLLFFDLSFSVFATAPPKTACSASCRCFFVNLLCWQTNTYLLPFGLFFKSVPSPLTKDIFLFCAHFLENTFISFKVQKKCAQQQIQNLVEVHEVGLGLLKCYFEYFCAFWMRLGHIQSHCHWHFHQAFLYCQKHFFQVQWLPSELPEHFRQVPSQIH